MLLRVLLLWLPYTAQWVLLLSAEPSNAFLASPRRCVLVAGEFHDVKLSMLADSQNSGEDPEEDEGSAEEGPPAPPNKDWRAYRAALVRRGLPVGDKPIKEGVNVADNVDTQAKKKEGVRDVGPRKSLLDILERSPETLAKVYQDRHVWAHALDNPEPGCLLVRNTLEGQAIFSNRQKNKADASKGSNVPLLNSENKFDLDPLLNSINDFSGMVGLMDSLNTRFQLEEMMSPKPIFPEESKETTKKRIDNLRTFSTPLQQYLWINFVHETTQRRLKDLLARGWTTTEKPLLLFHLHFRKSRYFVFLVLEHDVGQKGTQPQQQDKPASRTRSCRLLLLNQSLGCTPTAEELLFGQTGRTSNSYSADFLAQFERAFFGTAAEHNQTRPLPPFVYCGGPTDLHGPALMLHGISNLTGAQEIAPDTGLYLGGVEAAVDGILGGRHQPKDFKFFLGHTLWEEETDDSLSLFSASQEGVAFQPVACSQSVVLQQWLEPEFGKSKSLYLGLWNDALELCGGELKMMALVDKRRRLKRFEEEHGAQGQSLQ